MSNKDKGFNTELEKAINMLLKQTMADERSTLVDKCRVLDRAINIEKLKLKISEDEWGSGFSDEQDDAE